MNGKTKITISGICFLISAILDFSIFSNNLNAENIFYIIVYSLPPLLMTIFLIGDLKNIVKLKSKDITLIYPYIIAIILYVISRIYATVNNPNTNFSSAIFNIYSIYYLMYHIIFVIAVMIDIKSLNIKTNFIYFISAGIMFIYIIKNLLSYPFYTEIATTFTEMLGIILIGIYENTKNNNNTPINTFNTVNQAKTNNDIEKLLKYKNLLDKGLITESEFNDLKKKIFKETLINSQV